MSDLVGQQLGSYKLIEKLGVGGFADVYLGEHIYIKNKKDAIKVFKGTFSKPDIEKARTEAQLIYNLAHPHIVKVRDFNVATLDGQDIPFLVMDYAPYGSLRKLHPYGTKLSLATIISYVKPIAAALQYAHQYVHDQGEGVIHRDIKPGNILLGENKELLLSDFGNAVIAHSTASMPTQDKTGTWQYMAPEQFVGRPRPASDQYALAAVVYEWLCGEPPFAGPGFDLFNYQHTYVTPPPLGKNVFPAVEAVVLKALAKDPKERFPSVQDFADELEKAYIEGITTCLDTPERTSEFFTQEYVQQAILERILKNADWWDSFAKPRIISLRQNSTNPVLASAFVLFAKRVIPLAVSVMKEDASIRETEAERNISIFRRLLTVLICVTPPEDEPDVWLAFLHEILENKKALLFIEKHWDIHTQLLRIWDKVLVSTPENNKLIRPLLRLEWSQFGEFLALGLQKGWYPIATALLTNSSSVLTSNIIQNLEQIYDPQVEDLFRQLVNDSQWWPTAKSLFTLLVANGYKQKVTLLATLFSSATSEGDMREVLAVAKLSDGEYAEFFDRCSQRAFVSAQQFHIMMEVFDKLVMHGYSGKMERLFILLDSPMGSQNIEEMLKAARLTVEEAAKVLERYGKRYLESYQQAPQLSAIALNLFGMLKSNYSEKMRLFFILFDAQTNKENLERLLVLAQLATEESIDFFNRYGSDQRYLPFFCQSPTALALFTNLAKSGYSDKMKLLFAWLKTPMSLEELEKVLEAAYLTTREEATFLEHFGEQYLQRFPHSPTLLKYIRHYLQDLNIEDFRKRTNTLSPIPLWINHPRHFFHFLSGCSEQLPQDIQAYIQSWKNIVSFINQAIINKAQLTRLSSALSGVPLKTRTKLFEELAQVFANCVEDEIDLIRVMDAINPTLGSDTLKLFYMIAKRVGKVPKAQDPETLFVPYIRVVLELEKVYDIAANERERFVQEFLDALLQNIDQSTFEKLNRLVAVQAWPSKVSAQWGDYVSQSNLKNGVGNGNRAQDALQPLPVPQTPIRRNANIELLPPANNFFSKRVSGYKPPARGLARYPWASTFLTLLIIGLGVFTLYFYHLGPFVSPTPTSTPSPCLAVVKQLTDNAPPPDTATFNKTQHTYSAAPKMSIDTKEVYCAGINTNRGLIALELDPQQAPNTVNNFVFLAQHHFYDGIKFHRVVPGFIIQSGDPLGNGTGGPGYMFNDEPVKGNYTAGCVAMANYGGNRNGSQFFICTADDTKTLQKSYNLFGHVVQGLDIAKKIQGPGDDDSSKNIKPDVINQVVVVAAS